MANRERMERYRQIPYSEWKCYAVPTVGGWSDWFYVEAPNKTVARMMALGELNPWIKVKGKVREITEDEYPKYRVFGPDNYDGWTPKK